MPEKIIPTAYHLSYSLASPGMEIEAGAAISTSLADAHGFNEKMEVVAGSPNPLTGPFIIPGASPGQAIAVTIESLAPNRPHGWASKDIHPNLRSAVDRSVRYPKEYVDWNIDFERGVASPLGDHFKGQPIELPIHPVLGCIGTVPDGHTAVPSIDSGPFGGNLDYPRIATGATIYLPVNVRGAYLYLGDGHAIQGAGEITGNGIEISCDITFTATPTKMNNRYPRGEDESYLFCMGIADTLDDACRIATCEMEDWLTSRFHLSKDQTGILLGQLVNYEIGNFVSRTFCVSCLIPKQHIPRL